MRSSVLIIFFFVALPTAAAAQEPLNLSCTGDPRDSGGFGGSLSALFSNLSFASFSSNAANDTAGAGTDAAYGLYMCQGDLPNVNCQRCVRVAIDNISQSCAGFPKGIIIYDECLLRYSDANFFGQVDSASFIMTNHNEMTSSMKPYEMMSELVEKAPFQPLKFASNFSDLYPIFAMAQCTSDLTSDSCHVCLTSILNSTRACCLRQKGWRYISPSCWIRYEATPFLYGRIYSIIRSRCSADDFPAALLDSEQSNLQTVVAQLESNANSNGFYNTTTDHQRNIGDLFGLALCREDPAALPSSACTGCLNIAGTAIAGECPNKTQGIMWYDDCLLRYSNQSFFNAVDSEGRTFCSQETVSSETDKITITGARMVIEAAVGNASLFASGIITLSNANTSYVTAQCTRDLSRENCQSCLEDGMSRIMVNCTRKRGWQFLSGSCMIRYEVNPFFDPTAATIIIHAGGGGRSSNVRVIAIVLPIAGVLLLLGVGLLLFRRWKLRRKRGNWCG